MGVGVGVNVVEPLKKEVDVAELADVVELVDVGKQHKQLRHLL